MSSLSLSYLLDWDEESVYSDSDCYDEELPYTFVQPEWEKDDTLIYEDQGLWSITECSYSFDSNAISASRVVDQYYPNLQPGHILPMAVGPYPFLVMIVMALPGILHGVTTGQITHCPVGGIAPGEHRTVFIGPKQYLIRILGLVRSRALENVGLVEDSFEETDIRRSPDDEVLSWESDAESLAAEDADNEWDDEDGDGEDAEGEWEEDSEWEEWTPESIESFSTLPLYSPATMLPPPYPSPSDLSTANLPADPPPFDGCPSDTPRIIFEEQSQRPTISSSTPSTLFEWRARDNDNDDDGADLNEDSGDDDETDSGDTDPSPTCSLAPGQSALWAGTEGGQPTAPPRRDLPQPPTGIPPPAPVTLVNDIQNPFVETPRLPKLVRLSPLDIEIPRPLPSVSLATNSGTPRRTIASRGSEEDAPAAPSPTLAIPSGTIVEEGPSFRTPITNGRGCQQATPSSPVIGRGCSYIQVSPQIDPNLFPTFYESSPPATNSPPQSTCSPESTLTTEFQDDEPSCLVQSPFPVLDLRKIGYYFLPRSADDPRSPRYTMVLDSPDSYMRGGARDF